MGQAGEAAVTAVGSKLEARGGLIISWTSLFPLFPCLFCNKLLVLLLTDPSEMTQKGLRH